MILYGIIIIVSMIIDVLINIFFVKAATNLTYIISVIYFVILLILIDGIFAGIIRWFIPKKFINKDHKIYQVSKKEIQIYDFFGMKRWKHLIPDLGQFTNFQKNKIENPKDNVYLERYIMEAIYGMWGHLIGAPMGFLVLLFDFNMYNNGSTLWLTVALPCAIINLILDIIPAFVLRYNLNRLQVMYKFNARHQNK